MSQRKPRRPPPRRRPSTALTVVNQDNAMLAQAQPATTVITPRQRLLQLAREGGHAPVEAIQGLLADHLLGADGHARSLAMQRDQMLQMLLVSTTPPDRDEQDGEVAEERPPAPPADPLALLEVLARLDRLHTASLAELRRTAELMHRLSAPARPQVEVLALATGEQVNIGGQQVCGHGAGSGNGNGSFRRPG